MKNKWSKYALKDGKIKQSYLRERVPGSKKRKAPETSCGNCIEQSRKEQEEINFTLNQELDSMSKAKLESKEKKPQSVSAAAGKKPGKKKMEKMDKSGKN